MIKVLHFVEAFGGGVFASVTQTCNALAQRGHHVILVCSPRSEAPKDWRVHLSPEVKVYELKMQREISPFLDILALIKLIKVLNNEAPDVVHLHSSKSGVIGRIAHLFLLKRHKLFYSPRGLPFIQTDISNVKKVMFKFIEQCAHLLGGTIVACSDSEKKLVKENISNQRVVVIENSVDLSKLPPLRVDRLRKSITRIGIVGRITTARNPQQFARVALQFADNPNVNFVWIGGGDPLQEAALIDSGVEVTGWLSREEALEAMLTLDIYMQTSLWEGMPVAVIEAQCLGIPCVVTDVVGNRDIILHNVTGMIANSEKGLVLGCKQLVEDYELRLRFGKSAFSLARERFSVSRMLSELEDLYR